MNNRRKKLDTKIKQTRQEAIEKVKVSSKRNFDSIQSDFKDDAFYLDYFKKETHTEKG